ncbi:MAG: ribonuclease HII [Candidatus Paceibacterota bacterium]
MKKEKYIIGIDEVGRGPIAGPVAVGACVLLQKLPRGFTTGLRDSKKLSEKKREEWLIKMMRAQKEGLLDFAVSYISHSIIDAKGLSYAIRTALSRALTQVVQRNSLKPECCRVMLDGGLKAPIEFSKQKTIIKGDEKIPVISLASIAAKVSRDTYMKKLAKKYPEYGFEVHKGYGTAKHYENIVAFGQCKIHRISFLKGLTK